MKKLLLSLLLVFGLCLGLTACGDSDSTDGSKKQETQEEKEEKKVYSVGESFVYSEDGKETFKLTINSVTATKERNEFDDSNPEQVIVINYTYENLGKDDKLYISSMDFTLVDEEGNVCSTYPLGSISKYPQETPKGAKCTAEEAYGLIAKSSKVKLQVNTDWFDDSNATDFELVIK